MSWPPPLHDTVLAVLMLAFLLTTIRLVRGPSLPDRVVALDLLAAIMVGIVSMDAIRAEQGVYIDVAIVIGLITFLGTAAFARYLELREHDE